MMASMYPKSAILISFAITLAVTSKLVTAQASFSCDFESDLCGYAQDTLDNFDWVRQSGSTSTDDTGPDVDHTHGTSLGYYIYAEASSPQQPGQKARIISPVEPVSSSKCVEFYYFMLGEHMGSLRVYTRGNDSTSLSEPVWERSGNQGNRWYRGLATVDLAQENYVELIIEAEIGSGVRSDIAVDDVMVMQGDEICPVDNFACTFEDGLCGITQDNTDNFDFVRRRGSTPSFNTGPTTDHTIGTSAGYYVYIESSGITRGYKARLISPKVRGLQENDPETFCVIFWYHMYGQYVDELNVYLRNASSTDLGNPIWALAGSRGDLWRAGEAELNSPDDFYVVFEAQRGYSFASDIAIDDITITGYACPGHHIIKNESSVTCDFEEAEICYYTQDNSDNLDWGWRNRGTPDTFTGPEQDHTRGDELGFFMYISSSYYTDSSDRARLISPVTRQSSAASCVEFWYHMNGMDVESLSVYIKPDGGSLPSSPAWTKSGNQRNYWHRATFDIPASTPDYQIVFEGTPGDLNRDDIALDDVTLYESASCPVFTTIAPPPTTTPPPTTNISCDFEEDFCGYSQETEDDFGDWARYRGSGPYSYRTGPTTDHTLGTSSGYYASFDPYYLYSLRKDDSAILISPLVETSSDPRCLTFYAYMYGLYVDYLNIYIRPWGGTRSLDPLFSVYGNQGQQWRLMEMAVPPSTNNFQILFEAVIGRNRYSSEIAIDDIELVDGTCPTVVTPTPLPWAADCDFEADGTLCGYRQSTADNFNWVRHTGSTGSDTTGPKVDHTLGTAEGHYMYIETSMPQRPNEMASLLSPKINSHNDDLCLRFYYHAFGDDTGSLVVKLKIDDIDTAREVFRVTGNKGDQWIPANVNVGAGVTGFADFEVRFQGRKGTGHKGDIALDDIKFLQRPCEGYPTESLCTFELGMEYYGYSNAKVADFNWAWYDAIGTEASPLPNSISTSFMYASASGNTDGSLAVLYSDVYELMGMTHCLTVDFVLSSDQTQELRLEIEEKETGQRKPLTILPRDTGDEWQRGNWTLASDLTDKPYQLVFTAKVGTGRNGVMAVDNILLSTTLDACEQFVPPPPIVTTRPTTTRQPTTTPTPPAPSSQSPTATTPSPTTDGNGNPHRREGRLGLIIGVTIVVLLLIAVVIMVVVVCRVKPSWAYKKDKLDEIPFEGVTNEKHQECPPVAFQAPDTNGSVA